MRGSTKNIQYGIPASFSAPMEPYLKRMSGVAVTQLGCGSSRKNLYQPIAAPRPASTARTAKQIFHADFLFAASAINSPYAADAPSGWRSEGLEILNQGI